MALEIDSAEARRNYSSLKELVLAIRDSKDPNAEHHAIEWKSALDLATKEGQFAVARAIIGMGNRTVEAAARHFAGVGYVVVGVEPGKVTGTASWDGANLDPLLAAYLGPDGPVWHHDNIDVDGVNVLVFTIEPPRRGDHIHTLRKAFNSNVTKASGTDGDVFIRRHAATGRANTTEIRALENRLLSETGQPRLDVEVMPVAGTRVFGIAMDLSAKAIDQMVARERESFSSKSDEQSATSGFGVRVSTALDPGYSERVETYLRKWREVAPQLFRDRIIGRAEANNLRVRLCVRNPGEEAIEDVRVTLIFPPGIEPYFEKIDPELPSRPVRSALSISGGPDIHRFVPLRPPPASSVLLPTVMVREDGRWEVAYSSYTIHSGETIELESFVVLIPDADAFDTLGEPSIEAKITSRNRSGISGSRIPITRTENLLLPSMVGLADAP